jgi:hypothetical protein
MIEFRASEQYGWDLGAERQGVRIAIPSFLHLSSPEKSVSHVAPLMRSRQVTFEGFHKVG